MWRVAAFGFLLCLAIPAGAKDFPFGEFKPTTFKQLLLDEADHSERDQYSTPGSRIFHPPVRVKVIAEYTGEHRPLSATTAKFIEQYGASHPGNEAWAATFTEEWLFEAEGRKWWLPVQNQVSEYFPTELHPGDAVELYVVYAGVQWLEKDYDVMLLLEEFQRPSRG